jgi:hypothetical protein
MALWDLRQSIESHVPLWNVLLFVGIAILVTFYFEKMFENILKKRFKKITISEQEVQIPKNVGLGTLAQSLSDGMGYDRMLMIGFKNDGDTCQILRFNIRGVDESMASHLLTKTVLDRMTVGSTNTEAALKDKASESPHVHLCKPWDDQEGEK